MAVPMFEPKIGVELARECDGILAAIRPFTVKQLEQLDAAGALDYERGTLLDRYKTLSWLLKD